MDAVKYFEEKKRMLDSLGRTGGRCYGVNCLNCPLKTNNRIDAGCLELEVCHPEEAVAIVERWAAKHPRKTLLSDFLEKYPNALVSINGIPKICPKYLGYPTVDICSGGNDCIECWNRPIEEGEK